MDPGLNGGYPADRKSRSMAKKSKITKAKILDAHITRLEMYKPLSKMPPVPIKPPIALIRANDIPGEYYAYLYEQVGKAHHWEERRDLDHEELDNIVNQEDVEVSVIYADGCPAGFFELDLSGKPEFVEIKYLGLAPDYQGLGMGNWFVAAAISAAWAHKPDFIKIETNTLDHPAALQLYQRLGFSPVAVADAKIKAWD